LPRDLRDPEQLGIGLHYWRHQPEYKDTPLHEIADLINRSMHVEDYRDRTIGDETVAAYQKELLEAAQHDPSAWDLAREKGWVQDVAFEDRQVSHTTRCHVHTQDGLQQCMLNWPHSNSEHFFPDGTRHA